MEIKIEAIKNTEFQNKVRYQIRNFELTLRN